MESFIARVGGGAEQSKPCADSLLDLGLDKGCVMSEGEGLGSQ